MKGLGFVPGAAVLAVTLQGGVAQAADEYAVHKFKCPTTSTVKFENLTHAAHFKESTVNVSARSVARRARTRAPR